MLVLLLLCSTSQSHLCLANFHPGAKWSRFSNSRPFWILRFLLNGRPGSDFLFNLSPLFRGFQEQRRYVLIPHYLVELSYILRFDLF
jgi:hypothetical protein